MSTDAVKTIKVDRATHRRLRQVAAATDSTIAATVRDLSVLAHGRLVRLQDKPKEKAS